jgi:20S proteasome alpha/beta subunit
MPTTTLKRISQRRRLRLRHGSNNTGSERWVLALVVAAMLLMMAVIVVPSTTLLFVDASSAAGTETLVGIVGRDFVLLGADSSASQSIALTASNLDKIAHLVEPFPSVPKQNKQKRKKTNGSSGDDADVDADADADDDDDDGETERFNRIQQRQQQLQQQWQGRPRQQTILAAAAGDAADSDRLLGYLKAIGSLEEYKNGGIGCDVQCVSLDGGNGDSDSDGWNGNFASSATTRNNNGGGLDAKSMAHLARRCIWEKLRSKTPYRICLLVAGMMLDDDIDVGDGIDIGDESALGFNGDDDDDEKHQNGGANKGESSSRAGGETTAFLSQRVQKQVKQAWRKTEDTTDPANAEDEKHSLSPTLRRVSPNHHQHHRRNNNNNIKYKPSLYWLDEYGSLQSIEYGAHGHGSNFLLSILDQNYKHDLTRAEALELMNKCFEELRSRYVVNSPEAPCIKCVDVDGVRLM